MRRTERERERGGRKHALSVLKEKKKRNKKAVLYLTSVVFESRFSFLFFQCAYVRMAGVQERKKKGKGDL